MIENEARVGLLGCSLCRRCAQVYGIKGKQKQFKKGETVTFTVGEALNWMGLDLDKPIDQQPNPRWFEELNPPFPVPLPGNLGYPKLRATGVENRYTLVISNLFLYFV